MESWHLSDMPLLAQRCRALRPPPHSMFSIQGVGGVGARSVRRVTPLIRFPPRIPIAKNHEGRKEGRRSEGGGEKFIPEFLVGTI